MVSTSDWLIDWLIGLINNSWWLNKSGWIVSCMMANRPGVLCSIDGSGFLTYHGWNFEVYLKSIRSQSSIRHLLVFDKSVEIEGIWLILRFEFMASKVDFFYWKGHCWFLVNLPPTLSKSQVSSVRKNLKMQMLSLLRLPSSLDFQSNITTLLTDLGATQSEVMRNASGQCQSIS